MPANSAGEPRRFSLTFCAGRAAMVPEIRQRRECGGAFLESTRRRRRQCRCVGGKRPGIRSRIAGRKQGIKFALQSCNGGTP